MSTWISGTGSLEKDMIVACRQIIEITCYAAITYYLFHLSVFYKLILYQDLAH